MRVGKENKTLLKYVLPSLVKRFAMSESPLYPISFKVLLIKVVITEVPQFRAMSPLR